VLLGVVDYTSESGTPILQNTAEILQINLAGKANLPVESMSGSGGTGRRNICLRPTEGADFYQIAKNFRTSAEMIDASHIKNQLSAAAISAKRPPDGRSSRRPKVPSPAKPSHLKTQRRRSRTNYSRHKPLA